MSTSSRDESVTNNPHPVDSTTYTLPDGRKVIGRDAYEAEMVKATFATPPKVSRPFGFSVEIQAGQLFVDVRGESVLTFKWGHGWYVGTNHFTINSNAEEDRIEKMWSDVGREVGHRQAKEVAAKQLEQALQACEDRFKKWPGTGFPPAAATAGEEQS